ncbi:MAG: transcriptional repressor [Pseudomonadota bacterium]
MSDEQHHSHNHADGAPGEPPAGLSKNERLVWAALHDFGEPMKAYEILDRLKEKGVRAPMTVYRALDGLETKGHVHKLEGLNAFVLCNHGGPHMVQTFLVCESCSNVQELQVSAVEDNIIPAVSAASFRMETARLEIKGSCQTCASA